MRVLVFDTETTGLAPKSNIIEVNNLHEWPYIVQFSALVYDTSVNEIVDTINHYIRLPLGVTIPAETTKIHGITNEMCETLGVDLYEVIESFSQKLNNVSLVIAHNMKFDGNVTKAEIMRLIHNPFTPTHQIMIASHFLEKFNNFTEKFCTMEEFTQFCNIQRPFKNGKSYTKYPSLLELHQKLYEKDPIGLHNSFYDCLVTLRCYIKLKHNIDPFEQSATFKHYSSSIYV